MPKIEHTCTLCGQPVDTLRDSFRRTESGVQHITCPTSPALANLAPADPDAPADAERPVFLTMEEAGQMLRVSTQTIRRRIRAGDLPAKRLRGGQTVLVNQRDVLALLEDLKEDA